MSLGDGQAQRPFLGLFSTTFHLLAPQLVYNMRSVNVRGTLSENDAKPEYQPSSSGPSPLQNPPLIALQPLGLQVICPDSIRARSCLKAVTEPHSLTFPLPSGPLPAMDVGLARREVPVSWMILILWIHI